MHEYEQHLKEHFGSELLVEVVELLSIDDPEMAKRHAAATAPKDSVKIIPPPRTRAREA